MCWPIHLHACLAVTTVRGVSSTVTGVADRAVGPPDAKRRCAGSEGLWARTANHTTWRGGSPEPIWLGPVLNHRHPTEVHTRLISSPWIDGGTDVEARNSNSLSGVGRVGQSGYGWSGANGRCDRPGESGNPHALPRVDLAGPVTDVPAGSAQTAADHIPGIWWSAASCRSIRHRLLDIEDRPLAHISLRRSATRGTMVHHGEPPLAALFPFASAHAPR